MNMLKKLIGSLVLLIIIAGCGEADFSIVDEKNISGNQFYTIVESFKSDPIGIIIERRGVMHYYGAKIEDFDEDTLTGTLSTERYPDTPTKVIKREIARDDVFTSRLIKDDDGNVIGLYLITTKSNLKQGESWEPSQKWYSWLKVVVLFLIVLVLGKQMKKKQKL